MKVPTSKEGSDSFPKPKIPEGFYEAQLKEVKEVKEGQYGDRVGFVFNVTANNQPFDLIHICYVPQRATPDNKFGRVLMALGCELGSEIETDHLVGRSARVVVEDYEYTDNEGNKKVASSIAKVKPLSETQKVE